MEGNLQHPPTQRQRLRYNILQKLAGFDKPIRVRIRKRIMKNMKVSESTYSRWVHCKVDDSADIPGEALLLFATCLNCTIEDLFTEQNQ